MSTPAPAELPAGRYGPEPRPGARGRRLAALWALGLCGLALAVWIGIGAARVPVEWQDVGFVLDGSDGVEVVYDVIRTDPSVAVQCRLHALNQQYAEVGVVQVDVPPGTARAVRMSTTLATSELAVTGVVDRCWVP